MSTNIDLTTLPTPEHITILCKRHKSTVLLSVLSDQSFENIKEVLLKALESRKLSALPGSTTPLPSDAADLEFGILRDRKDPSKGWVSLEQKLPDTTDPKAGKRKNTGKADSPGNTPGSLGLVDGTLLAYRLRTTKAEQNDDDEMIDVLDDPGWDVVLPSYEDDLDGEA